MPVREAKNVPDWVNQDHYDDTLKPSAGWTREQQRDMMHAVFVERMKPVFVIDHIEPPTVDQ